MSTLRLPRHLWILPAAPAILLASCVPGGTPASAPAPRPTPLVSRDIGKLGRLITLPRRPLAAVWRYEQLGAGGLGPSDHAIQAVMKFSPRDLQALTANATRREAAKPGVVAAEPWFPPALRQQAKSSKGILRADGLDAGDFHKMSFIRGKLWRLRGTDTLFVSLSTS